MLLKTAVMMIAHYDKLNTGAAMITLVQDTDQKSPLRGPRRDWPKGGIPTNQRCFLASAGRNPNTMTQPFFSGQRRGTKAFSPARMFGCAATCVLLAQVVT